MLRREKRKQQQEKEAPPQGQQDDGGQRDEEEEEEEEFPAGMDCEEEYDEEDVYVMVQLPSSVDGEALLSSSAVTVKVGCVLCVACVLLCVCGGARDPRVHLNRFYR